MRHVCTGEMCVTEMYDQEYIQEVYVVKRDVCMYVCMYVGRMVQERNFGGLNSRGCRRKTFTRR